VASYNDAGGINHIDGKNLPSKRAIAAITIDLLRLLFPGFFDEKLTHSSELKTETAKLVQTTLHNLELEVRKSLEYNPPPEHPRKELRAVANNLYVGISRQPAPLARDAPDGC
jgi:serine O-acetyltransferase